MNTQYNWPRDRILQSQRRKNKTYSNTETLLLRINKGLKYSSLINKIIKLRTKFLSSINQNRIPHPSKTHCIIYAMFNLSKIGPQALYIGKTTNNCFTRRKQHIQKSNNQNTKLLPISKFINKIKEQNLGILPLMSVPNYNENSHYFERLWIHKFKTHKKSKYWFQALNRSTEHSTYKYKQRHKTISNNLLPKTTQTKPIHTQFTNSIIHLLSYNQLTLQPPKALQYMSNHKLYKLLSILQNKPIYFHNKPTYFLIKQKIYNSINQSHQIILIHSTINKMNQLSKHISNQLDQNHNILKQPFPKQIPIKLEISTFEFIHPIIKQIKLNKILHEAQYLLPSNLKTNIEPKLIPKLQHSIIHSIYNYKEALQNMPKILNMQCICNKPELQQYTRQHGHIDTLDASILVHFTNNKTLATSLINLINKGNKFIETPQPSKIHIYNTLKKSINKLVDKLSLHTSKHLLIPWKTHIIKQIKIILEIIPIPNTPPTILNNPQAKQLINILHNHLVIQAPDKLPSNTAFSCKFWWYLELQQNIVNSHTTYKIITNKTSADIIKRQTAYLNKNGYTSVPKLPFKRLISKFHKPEPGLRPIVAAPNITTTSLDKSLTILLTAMIDHLKTEASLFQKIHGYTWFFDIDTAEQITTWIENLNKDPNHIPNNIITADAEGFYDSIRHSWLIKIYNSEINRIFNQHPRMFLYTSTKSKSYKWISIAKRNTNTIHYFTAKSAIRLLTWSLNNQFQLVGPHLVKQIIGVGQGLSHSGHQSRFGAICSERMFILEIQKTNPEIANIFGLTKRKHDDILFINNIYVKQYFHIHKDSPGLYPWFIKPKWTNSIPYNTTNYLNISISIVNNNFKGHNPNLNTFTCWSTKQLKTKLKQLHEKTSGTKNQLTIRLYNKIYPSPDYHNKSYIWTIKPWNKKSTFPYSIQKHMTSFPHFTSNIPHHIKTGVITGHLILLERTTLHYVSNFTDAIIQFFKQLIYTNQYPLRILKQILSKYLSFRIIFKTNSKKLFTIINKQL
jgi:hypothetical protein